MTLLSTLLVAEQAEPAQIDVVRTYKWLVSPSALTDVDKALEAAESANAGATKARTARPATAASTGAAKRRKKMDDEARKLAEASFD